MFKRFMAALFALVAATAFAAVDVNKATQAELETIKGVGPAIATKILDERKKGSFKDWTDLVDRVKGVGEGNAAKFSAEGLTVNGGGFKGVAAKPAAEAKPAAKAAEAKPAAKTEAAAPVAAAKTEKPAAAAKPEKAVQPTADKPAAEDKSAKKSKKDEAADKKAAKADKVAATASAPKK